MEKNIPAPYVGHALLLLVQVGRRQNALLPGASRPPGPRERTRIHVMLHMTAIRILEGC
jgi:hypothetical protein